MDSIEKVRKYLGKGDYFELVDEEGNIDRFLMMPIPFERTAEFWVLKGKIGEFAWKIRKESGKSMNDEPDVEESSKIMRMIDKETFGILLDMCYVSIENSKDFEGLDENEKRRFVSSNVTAMMPKLFQLNDFGDSHMSGDIEAIKRKEHLKRLKDAAKERETT